MLSGRRGPGQPLREEQLAARFGVSRHTVRSALALLVAERLLTAEAYRGVRVSTFDTDQLLELQQLRTALECEAVHVATAGGPVDRSGIVPAIDRLAEVEAAARDWVAVERAHAQVHQAIVDSARSTRLSAAYRTLEGELALLLLHTRGTYSSRDLAHEHRELLDAIDSSGPTAIRSHIAESTRSLLEHRACGGADSSGEGA